MSRHEVASVHDPKSVLSIRQQECDFMNFSELKNIPFIKK